MQITFPPGENFNFNDDTVTFRAVVDGKGVPCRVTLEAMQDNFGADIKRLPTDNFSNARAAIHRKATALIERQRFEPDGSITIRSQDGP